MRCRCRRLGVLGSSRIHPCFASCGEFGAPGTLSTVRIQRVHWPVGDQATKRSRDRGWDDLPSGPLSSHDSDKQGWVERSDDPTREEPAADVGSALRLTQPTRYPLFTVLAFIPAPQGCAYTGRVARLRRDVNA